MWRGATGVPTGISLGALYAAWDAMVWPSSWRMTRGPIGAAYLSLRRIGWKWTNPFTFVTDLGAEVMIPRIGPALLNRYLREA